MTSPAPDRQLTDQLHAIAREVSQSLLHAEATHSSADELQKAVDTALNRCLERLESLGPAGPDNQMPSNEFWQVAKPVLQRGKLQLHAREKPRGYAGDFQLLDHICQNRLPGEIRRSDAPPDLSHKPTGPDRLGRAMDAFFQSQPAPSAVRNRYRDIARQIVERASEIDTPQPVKILSIGSGPAWEVRWSMDELPARQIERLEVTLLDIDPAALEFCENNISRPKPESVDSASPKLTTTRINLGRFPRLKKLHAELGQFDLVYCAGLFDYLPDEQFVELLKSLWNLVGDKGTLLAFNFSDDNPSRSYMEWIGNWYLLHRSARQLDILAERANLAECAFQVESEEEGVNLYLRCRRT